MIVTDAWLASARRAASHVRACYRRRCTPTEYRFSHHHDRYQDGERDPSEQRIQRIDRSCSRREIDVKPEPDKEGDAAKEHPSVIAVHLFIARIGRKWRPSVCHAAGVLILI